MQSDPLFEELLGPKWGEAFDPDTFANRQKAIEARGGLINNNYDAAQYDYILTVYPEMKAGLELCCGNGRRIRGGRNGMRNIFGVNEKALSKMWELNGVSDFCKVGTVFKIPYKKNTFDFICYPAALKKSKKALREMKRVCYGRFYLKLDGDVPADEWIKLLVDEGYYLDVFHRSDDGVYVAEGKFLRGSI